MKRNFGLKIAVLLRTADAAHLDARRAPGFLLALRRPEGLSRDHWNFQNHLLKPRAKEDRLVYTTNRPFLAEQVDAWWVCEETLRMVDRELHQVDTLLADRGNPERLQIRGVSGAESPLRLKKYIEVDGWTPVDARLHVSNVADLARKLGGEELYGDDPTIPLRELIQNASDAVRARRLLENRSSDWGRVTVRLGPDEQGVWLEVEDTGIGMSEAVVSGPLLDFGTTYWGSALMRDEHEGLWAKGFEPTGRFGIGFFSVFMWGHRVRVTTRPYNSGPKETLVLEFSTGLEARPLLRPAKTEEQLQDGGTIVRVWLEVSLDDAGDVLGYREVSGANNLGDFCAWLAPALEVDLYVKGEDGERERVVVAGNDWLILDSRQLMARLQLHPQAAKDAEMIYPFLRDVRGQRGDILGRACLAPYELFSHIGSFDEIGIATVGGLRSGTLDGVAGIFLGEASTAARDASIVGAGTEILAQWASEQSEGVAEEIDEPDFQMLFAATIISLGGDPGGLPLGKVGEKFLDRQALMSWAAMMREICILDRTPGPIVLHAHVIVTKRTARVFRFKLGRPSPMSLIGQIVREVWGGCVEEFYGKKEYEIGVGKSTHEPILRSYVTVLRRPA